MYFLLFLFVLIFGAIQEWSLTARVYAWLATENPAGVATLQILLSFVLSAFLGMKLFSRVGPQLVRKAQQQLARGQVPDRMLAEGLLLGVGAILLILPGYLSDLFGILIILLRGVIGGFLVKAFKKKIEKGGMNFRTYGSNGFSASYGSSSWAEHRKTSVSQPERIGDSPLVIDVEASEEKK